jgi:hypothetical protein
MIGFFAIVRSMLRVTRPPAESPINTSQSTTASARVRRGSLFGRAKAARNSSRSGRPSTSTPFTSTIVIDSRFTPSRTHICMQLVAAAPAPMQHTWSSSSRLFCNSAALRNPAAEMMAVPC